MKKVMLLLLVVAVALMVGGATCNQFLCNPTPEQQTKADVGLAVAQSILSAAAIIVPATTGHPELSPLAQQISQSAIPVFQRVRDGYCVAQAEWDNAVQKLADAQDKLMSTKKAIGYKAFDPAILQTTWSK